jgi:protoporphyrinogen oxidase
MNLANVELNHKLVKLDPRARTLHFENGVVVRYDAVISSIPLPDLIPIISGTPADVVEASEMLTCSSCVVVNIGVDREDISKAHWTYFYDRDIVFTRLSFPYMMSPHNVPRGAGSIQAEIYFSRKYKPFYGLPQDFIKPVIVDLLKCGLLREEDKVIFSTAMVVDYANIIFDLDRTKALATVHGYLDDIEIGHCGRYGEWGYLWTDEAFKSGEKAAQKTIEKMKS